ncbi:response regulator receiver protein [Methanohalobium evestigatum Z-7303]|uniref:Response regulator receiver protein n=1 Tax=Methanohalobium evestigatum (strain ATCC BAA-1072 / DSM 3721 / NBRC 107634 / OCM 161 / Z-7303) TaxID=644295 RepID=D7E992_METEZ|nr:methanogen output domain 1-containing protein [Methanohalobium evestigatum]ADI74040.1 response regulator receiver protein [Methanohalobium evestigatum Z-7303]
MERDNSESKILIVDDEPELVELLADYLDGYNTIAAYNGQEAINIIESDNIDVILLDVMMPDINGFEVCTHIKNDDSLNYIPVLMITALSDHDNKIHGLDSGADDFLTKPVDGEELNARVRSALRIKKLHDELMKNLNELYTQHQIRNILTGIIPTLLQQLPKEKKKILIHQMVKEIESLFNEIYVSNNKYKDTLELDSENINPDNVKKTCTEVMNYLGADFIAKEPDSKDNVLFALENTICPWGASQAKMNPILCNLTKKIFYNVASKAYSNVSINTVKTIGNGNCSCYFEILKNC